MDAILEVRLPRPRRLAPRYGPESRSTADPRSEIFSAPPRVPTTRVADGVDVVPTAHPPRASDRFARRAHRLTSRASPPRRHTAGCVLAGAHRRVAARRDPARRRRRRRRRLSTKEERRRRRAERVAARGGDRRRLRDARRVRRRGASHGARGVRGGAPRLVRATKYAYDRGTRSRGCARDGERHRGEARRRRRAGSRRVPSPSRFFFVFFAREPSPREAPLSRDLRRGHRGRVAVPEPGRDSAAAGRRERERERERVRRMRRVSRTPPLDGRLVADARRASHASTDGLDEASETHPADVHETRRRRGSRSAYRRDTRRVGGREKVRRVPRASRHAPARRGDAGGF